MLLISSQGRLSVNPDTAFGLSKPSMDRAQNNFSNLSSPNSSHSSCQPDNWFFLPNTLNIPLPFSCRFISLELNLPTTPPSPLWPTVCILLILESGLVLSLPITYSRSDIAWLPRPGQKSPHRFLPETTMLWRLRAPQWQPTWALKWFPTESRHQHQPCVAAILDIQPLEASDDYTPLYVTTTT